MFDNEPLKAIILLGLTGNLLILVTVVRSPAMRTTSNIYICNMAISGDSNNMLKNMPHAPLDMMICLTAAPVTPLSAFTGSWHFGWLPCKLLPLFQVVRFWILNLRFRIY